MSASQSVLSGWSLSHCPISDHSFSVRDSFLFAGQFEVLGGPQNRADCSYPFDLLWEQRDSSSSQHRYPKRQHPQKSQGISPQVIEQEQEHLLIAAVPVDDANEILRQQVDRKTLRIKPDIDRGAL